MKICSNVPDHMTKMASRPIYGKNLLRKQEADDIETWYTASGTKVLCSNDDPGLLTLTCEICFLMLLHR